MALSRRDFTALLSGAFAGLVLPTRAHAAQHRLLDIAGIRGTNQETFFQWVRVRPNVQVALGGGGNTVLYLGRRGALQSDGKNFGLGRVVRAEAESMDVTVTHFVNTHHHGDHSGGNEGFKDILKVSHENAAPRIRASVEGSLGRAEEALPRLLGQLRQNDAPSSAIAGVEDMLDELSSLSVSDFMPDRTFSDEHEITVDGLSVECRWVSRGHTDGDNFVYLPEANVLHCGDLFFHGRHPFVDDSAGATPSGWVRCVDGMLALCDDDTVVVPGHGAITDRAGLQGQKEYFLRLQRMVQAGMRDGRSKEEIVAEAPEDLASLTGAERHLPRNLGFVYDEMAV